MPCHRNMTHVVVVLPPCLPTYVARDQQLGWQRRAETKINCHGEPVEPVRQTGGCRVKLIREAEAAAGCWLDAGSMLVLVGEIQ